ncbi:Eukaryotic translation elongation factor 1 epsilon-1 [Bulinus truncatus]|nr:Eukaryotic translation elongation factor 1 epsilon-1 [Bulinus truncatus]
MIRAPDIFEYMIRAPDIFEYMIRAPDIFEYMIRAPDIFEYMIRAPDIFEYMIREPDIFEYMIREPDIFEYMIRTPNIFEKVVGSPILSNNMASLTTIKYLNDTYKKKIKSSDKGLSLNLNDGKNISGITSIAKYLQRTQAEFQDLSLEDRMVVEQWLEYRNMINSCSDDQESQKIILKELNSYLKDRVFFVSERLTLADVLVYHSLHDIYKKVTFQEKENYIHLSRWFNNVQQDKRIRQSLQPLKFLRTLIYDGSSSH